MADCFCQSYVVRETIVPAAALWSLPANVSNMTCGDDLPALRQLAELVSE
jgi:hypothetical protein